MKIGTGKRENEKKLMEHRSTRRRYAMKKMWKRLLSFTLVIVMVATMTPIQAKAADAGYQCRLLYRNVANGGISAVIPLGVLFNDSGVGTNYQNENTSGGFVGVKTPVHYIVYEYGGEQVDSRLARPMQNYNAWKRMSDADKRQVTKWFAGFSSQLAKQFANSKEMLEWASEQNGWLQAWKQVRARIADKYYTTYANFYGDPTSPKPAPNISTYLNKLEEFSELSGKEHAELEQKVNDYQVAYAEGLDSYQKLIKLKNIQTKISVTAMTSDLVQVIVDNMVIGSPLKPANTVEELKDAAVQFADNMLEISESFKKTELYKYTKQGIIDGLTGEDGRIDSKEAAEIVDAYWKVIKERENYTEAGYLTVSRMKEDLDKEFEVALAADKKRNEVAEAAKAAIENAHAAAWNNGVAYSDGTQPEISVERSDYPEGEEGDAQYRDAAKKAAYNWACTQWEKEIANYSGYSKYISDFYKSGDGCFGATYTLKVADGQNTEEFVAPDVKVVDSYKGQEWHTSTIYENIFKKYMNAEWFDKFSDIDEDDVAYRWFYGDIDPSAYFSSNEHYEDIMNGIDKSFKEAIDFLTGVKSDYQEAADAWAPFYANYIADTQPIRNRLFTLANGVSQEYGEWGIDLQYIDGGSIFEHFNEERLTPDLQLIEKYTEEINTALSDIETELNRVQGLYDIFKDKRSTFEASLPDTYKMCKQTQDDIHYSMSQIRTYTDKLLDMQEDYPDWLKSYPNINELIYPVYSQQLYQQYYNNIPYTEKAYAEKAAEVFNLIRNIPEDERYCLEEVSDAAGILHSAFLLRFDTATGQETLSDIALKNLNDRFGGGGLSSIKDLYEYYEFENYDYGYLSYPETYVSDDGSYSETGETYAYYLRSRYDLPKLEETENVICLLQDLCGENQYIMEFRELSYEIMERRGDWLRQAKNGIRSSELVQYESKVGYTPRADNNSISSGTNDIINNATMYSYNPWPAMNYYKNNIVPVFDEIESYLDGTNTYIEVDSITSDDERRIDTSDGGNGNDNGDSDNQGDGSGTGDNSSGNGDLSTGDGGTTGGDLGSTGGTSGGTSAGGSTGSSGGTSTGGSTGSSGGADRSAVSEDDMTSKLDVEGIDRSTISEDALASKLDVEGADTLTISEDALASRLDPESADGEPAPLVTGQQLQLKATVVPANATYQEIVWISDNIDVAEVDGDGLVTAVGEGTAIITATAIDSPSSTPIRISFKIDVVEKEGNVSVNSTVEELQAQEEGFKLINANVTVNGGKAAFTGTLVYAGEDYYPPVKFVSAFYDGNRFIGSSVTDGDIVSGEGSPIKASINLNGNLSEGLNVKLYAVNDTNWTPVAEYEPVKTEGTDVETGDVETGEGGIYKLAVTAHETASEEAEDAVVIKAADIAENIELNVLDKNDKVLSAADVENGGQTLSGAYDGASKIRLAYKAAVEDKDYMVLALSEMGSPDTGNILYIAQAKAAGDTVTFDIYPERILAEDYQIYLCGGSGSGINELLRVAGFTGYVSDDSAEIYINRVSDLKLDKKAGGKVEEAGKFKGTLQLADNVSTSSDILGEEVKNIKWSSDDQNIVSDDDISCTGVNLYGNRTAELTVSFTPKKDGEVIVTGTASNGIEAKCKVTVAKAEENNDDDPEEPKTYNITYTLNEGVLEKPNPESYDANTEGFTLNNPVKDGYVFIGWTGSNGKEPQTVVTVTKGTTGDLEYFANWQEADPEDRDGFEGSGDNNGDSGNGGTGAGGAGTGGNGTDSTGSNGSGTGTGSTGNDNITETDNTSTPTAGTVESDVNGTAKYKVTSSDAASGEVEVSYESANSAGATVTIPSTVKLSDGTTATVTAVSDNAFAGNKKLTTVNISATVETIGNNAFKNCTKLKKVTIPKKVKSIGKNAFAGCTALTKVTIKSTVLTKIDQAAFKNCKKITSVTIPKSVTTIGKEAFSGDKKLKTVTIKSTKLKSIGKNAFKGIAKNAVIKVPKKQKKAYTKLLKKAGFKGKIK